MIAFNNLCLKYVGVSFYYGKNHTWTGGGKILAWLVGEEGPLSMYGENSLVRIYFYILVGRSLTTVFNVVSIRSIFRIKNSRTFIAKTRIRSVHTSFLANPHQSRLLPVASSSLEASCWELTKKMRRVTLPPVLIFLLVFRLPFSSRCCLWGVGLAICCAECHLHEKEP